MKISGIGEGAEWKYALCPTAPNELNYALPWLIMGPITFYPNKKVSLGQKTISRY
jgi:hypothetical protein